MKTIRRRSRQRDSVLEVLQGTKAHPTADRVFKMARRKIPSISFGTVYRNLNLLRDEGKLLELACGRYSSCYDADTSDHSHFFCLECEKVFDLDGPKLKDIDNKVSAKCGMEVRYHRINFYGYCKGCKR